MMVSQPLLGSPVEVRVMALPPQKRALLLIGHELAPVGTCGLLVQPTRTVAVPLNDLGGSLAYGEYLLEIPFDPALNGTQMALQIVLRAPAGQPTPAFSQGVRLTLAE
jgi:hypothetical protein